ncbi:hypothetical protein ALC56_06692 [Trachymyrmex septentrionalis]|uniref:Uncharacterized protein n=1 Tax=Trachymyrmex septentrionalis TaxID=34720 RepID=A0A151JWX0_9HYME|nr:hypothetical protein ALC56_06692 [Trachymyrmex septentrionalis]
MVKTKSISEREKTAKLITKTRASIRKKHRALKTGIMENEIVLEKQLKPIIEPLKQIAGNTERGGSREFDMMSVNKFGMPMRRDDSDEIEKSRSSIESLQNYVHDNGLCLNPDHYDAKERKIEHVAAAEFDTDVVNKSYVERTLRDTRNEIEESFRTIRRDTQEVRTDIEKMRRNVEEIQHLNRNVTVRMKNVVTNEILEKSFKMTGRDMIDMCASGYVERYLERCGKSAKQCGGSLEKCKRAINESV